MNKKAYYAEKSLLGTAFDISAKDKNSEARYIAAVKYAVRKDDGIAIISVNEGLCDEPSYWGIDYKSLGLLIEILEEDSAVNSIVLDVNSPGGDVSGLFDLTEQIFTAKKPIYSYSSGNLASAAYTIASATKAIFATESANIGSVGVFMSFYDDAERLKKMGVKEISFYGKNSDKKNLSPESAEGKDIYQAEINELEDILIKNIANYRGVTTDDVLENFGHGLMFRGNEALSRGMIDHVVTGFDQCIEMIKNADKTAIGGKGMAKDNEQKTVLAKTAENIDPEFLEQIKAQAKAEAEKEFEGRAAAEAQIAVAAERERVAELNKYAGLPQAEIAALAEQSKADGTSVEVFKEKFNLLAFELFRKNEFSSTSKSATAVLGEEANESACIVAAVEQSAGSHEEKSDIEKGKDLAAKVTARLKK